MLTNEGQLSGQSNVPAAALRHADRNRLLQLLLENEIIRLMAWHNPLNDAKKSKFIEPAIAKATGEVCTKFFFRSSKLRAYFLMIAFFSSNHLRFDGDRLFS